MIKLMCAKCREWHDGLKLKLGRLLCADCAAKPFNLPHHQRAILAEMLVQRSGCHAHWLKDMPPGKTGEHGEPEGRKWKRPDAKT